MINEEYIKNKKEKILQTIRNFNMDEQNRTFLKDKEEPGYNGCTFLYIRAFDSDQGVRPISIGTVFWLSPDIELYQNGVLVDTLNPLAANTTYSVRITVTNDGDFDCNVCTVDLFLCKPSIGFCINSALLVGVVNSPVPAHSTTTVELPFTTTEDMDGHQCMFARAYSLVDNDYPVDLVNFSTSTDRHIGQQNLNIVKQGSSYEFNVDIFHKNFKRNMEIILKKDSSSVIRKKLIMNERFTVSTKVIKTNLFKFEKLGLSKYDSDISRPFIINSLMVTKFDRKVNPFKKNIWLHKFESGLSKMKIDIPILGLNENEAVPMNISVRDTETGTIIGGITVIVIG